MSPFESLLPSLVSMAKPGIHDITRTSRGIMFQHEAGANVLQRGGPTYNAMLDFMTVAEDKAAELATQRFEAFKNQEAALDAASAIPRSKSWGGRLKDTLLRVPDAPPALQVLYSPRTPPLPQAEAELAQSIQAPPMPVAAPPMPARTPGLHFLQDWEIVEGRHGRFVKGKIVGHPNFQDCSVVATPYVRRYDPETDLFIVDGGTAVCLGHARPGTESKGSLLLATLKKDLPPVTRQVIDAPEVNGISPRGKVVDVAYTDGSTLSFDYKEPVGLVFGQLCREMKRAGIDVDWGQELSPADPHLARGVADITPPGFKRKVKKAPEQSPAPAATPQATTAAGANPSSAAAPGKEAPPLDADEAVRPNSKAEATAPNPSAATAAGKVPCFRVEQGGGLILTDEGKAVIEKGVKKAGDRLLKEQRFNPEHHKSVDEVFVEQGDGVAKLSIEQNKDSLKLSFRTSEMDFVETSHECFESKDGSKDIVTQLRITPNGLVPLAQELRDDTSEWLRRQQQQWDQAVAKVVNAVVGPMPSMTPVQGVSKDSAPDVPKQTAAGAVPQASPQPGTAEPGRKIIFTYTPAEGSADVYYFRVEHEKNGKIAQAELNHDRSLAALVAAKVVSRVETEETPNAVMFRIKHALDSKGNALTWEEVDAMAKTYLPILEKKPEPVLPTATPQPPRSAPAFRRFDPPVAATSQPSPSPEVGG